VRGHADSVRQAVRGNAVYTLVMKP
jgi:hypothetical protein